jgi:hypothetical protein
MGTRSLTYVYDETKTPIMCMYGQWDGYPSGYGADLSDFLNSFDCLVNGIPVGDNRKLANGMGCLSAQLVANFKKNVGSFYLYPPVVGQDCGQEYEYHIYEDSVMVLSGYGKDNNVIFNGPWPDFAEFCSEDYVA